MFPNKRMDDVLTELINHLNQTKFTYEELQFGTPMTIDETGLLGIPVSLETMPSETVNLLRLYPMSIDHFIDESHVVLNRDIDEPSSIVTALFEQYGIYLDEGTYTLEDVSPIIDEEEVVVDEEEEPVVETPVEDEEEEPGEEIPEVPINTPLLTDKRYLLKILDSHLYLRGEILIRLVPNLDLLGNSISSLIDLRKYFSTVNDVKYPIEAYVSNFDMTVDDYKLGEFLFESTDVNLSTIDLAYVLKRITNDEWVSEEEPAPFNLVDTRVMYNGFRKDSHLDIPESYQYVMELVLGDKCSNLIGVIQLGYRYDLSSKQFYRPGVFKKPIPMFNPR